MVGDQTLNSLITAIRYAAQEATTPSFTEALGYDVDHQAFPAITANTIISGSPNRPYVVSPTLTYVTLQQPDFVLLHSGTNNLNVAIASRMDTEAEIAAWVGETTAELSTLIDDVISAHYNPASLRILVTNFIPYSPDTYTNPVQTLTALSASDEYTLGIEAIVAARNVTRIILIDVATGFDIDTMTA